jgi:uncharacterized membrane protein
MKRRLPTLLLLFLAFNTTWFVLYSAQLGLQALLSDTPETLSRVFRRDSPLSGAGLALHMIAGGLLCLFAPLQALPVLRNRWPQIHRRLGYVLISLALITGIAGLFYITVQGTIGGWWMSLWFSLYGLALMWSALRTAQCAIRKDRRAHQIWATRQPAGGSHAGQTKRHPDSRRRHGVCRSWLHRIGNPHAQHRRAGPGRGAAERDV